MQILYLDGCILCTSCYLLFFLLCFLDPEEHPQNEEYWGHVNPIGPRACYDEGKRVAETMCYAYMKQVSSSLHVVNVHVIFKISFSNYLKFLPSSLYSSRYISGFGWVWLRNIQSCLWWYKRWLFLSSRLLLRADISAIMDWLTPAFDDQIWLTSLAFPAGRWYLFICLVSFSCSAAHYYVFFPLTPAGIFLFKSHDSILNCQWFT